MPRVRQRATFEEGWSVNINPVVKQIKSQIRSGLIATWLQTYTDYERGKITFRLRFNSNCGGWLNIKGADLDQMVEIVSEKRNLGGRQWYFVCPKTFQRASKLWKPFGAQYFASRHAWRGRVAYSSQFLDPMGRSMRGAEVKRDKLFGDTDMQEKPKWMRWLTYEKLLGKIDQYEAITEAYLAKWIKFAIERD